MAVLVQPLDRALPLHPTRRHAAPHNHRHPHLHVGRALTRPAPRALGMGLASGPVHAAGGSSQGRPSRRRWCVFAFWNKHHCSYFSPCAVRRQVVVPPRVWAGWVLGANPIGFVLGVDSAPYFARGPSGRVRSQRALCCHCWRRRACRDSLPTLRLCVPVRRRAAHVRGCCRPTLVITDWALIG
jgi:hypothetical protein